jgi:signal transduction histidine kinase
MDESTLRKMIITLKESSNNLYLLLEDLLQWSLSQSGKIEVKNENFNLNECLGNVLVPFKKEAQLKNIQLVNDLAETSMVNADVNLTKTILRNLLSNAVKFTKADGTIRIHVEIVFVEGKEFAQIFISDTGIGMDENTINSLFRLDRAQSRPGTSNEKGNGLGLLLSKEFAEKQGSMIKVESKVNQGSTFSFMLPKI